MSGIAGVWNLDGRPLEHGLLGGLMSPMQHRAHDGTGLWESGPVGVGCALARVTPEQEEQPFEHPTGAVVVFDGRLDDRNVLLADLRLTPEVDPLVPDVELVAAAYEVYGEDFVERLSGDFALAIFDPKKQWLLLARDAVGARPLYYHRTRGTFVFASEIKSLLADPATKTEPDERVLATLLPGARGLQAGDGSTFFRGIHSVLPAHLMVVRDGKPVHRRYWEFSRDLRTRLASPEGYAEVFRFEISRSVERRLRSTGPVAVPLAGDAYSTMVSSAAKRLAGRVSPPVTVVGLSNPESSIGFVARLEEVVRRSEVPLTSSVLRPALEGGHDDGRDGARVVLSEAFGDLSLGPFEANREEAPKWVDHLLEGRLRSGTSDWYSAGLRRWAKPRTKNPRRGTPRPAASIRSGVRSWAGRTSLGATSRSFGSYGMEAAFPLLDRDLLTFLTSISGEAAAEGVRLVLAGEGLAGGPSGVAGDRDRSSRQAELAKDWPAVLDRLLDRGVACDLGFVDRATLEEELPFMRDRVSAGDDGPFRAIETLLAMEVWLETFVRPSSA